LHAGAGNVVFFKLGSKLHHALTSRWVVRHGVLHTTSQVTECPTRHQKWIANEVSVDAHNIR